MEQRTKAWFEARMGKITSSELHKIMGAKGLGKTGESYLISKLGERLTGEKVEAFQNKAMEWGTEHEPIAREWIGKLNEWEIIEEGFIQSSNFDWFGGSPDGWIRNNNGMLEIKCPFTTEAHLKNAFYSKDYKTFKKELPAYYWQIVGNTYLRGCDNSYFATFDPRINSDLGLVVNQITVSDEDIQLMEERLIEAEGFIVEFENKLKLKV